MGISCKYNIIVFVDNLWTIKLQRNGCRGIKIPLRLLFNKHILRGHYKYKTGRKKQDCAY